MSKGNVTTGASALTVAEIQERISLVRRLVMLSLDFGAKSRANAELAQAALAELDAQLAHAASKAGAL